MNKILYKQWGVQRPKGRTRYILLWGVLGWGFPMALGLSLMVLADRRHGPQVECLIGINVISSLVGGYVFGIYM
jgi:hypothetical protein